MEDSEILKMVEDASRHHCFIIDSIVSDDDSTVKYIIKHQSIGAPGKVLK